MGSPTVWESRMSCEDFGAEGEAPDGALEWLFGVETSVTVGAACAGWFHERSPASDGSATSRC